MVRILARNALTWLNLILVVLGAATLATGSAPDSTFLLVAVLNTVVGTVQEVRAKATLDHLAVVSAVGMRVHRAGGVVDVPVEEVAEGDLVELRAGEQVGVDVKVGAGTAEVDESLVTGESDPVPKGPGDELISGTWLVGGSVTATVTAVGEDSYASRLASEARRYSLSGSELVDSLNRILRWLTVLIVAIAPLLLWRQLEVERWEEAVRATTAGLVGMVPEGLVLLTTIAFFTSAARLARRNVLVQELPAVETLARVDEICTDKTGTLTRGGISWGGLTVPSGAGRAGVTRVEVEAALGALSHDPDANATSAAIGAALAAPEGWEPVAEVGFTSARKWSGATFAGHGTWVLGAAEMVQAADPDDLAGAAARLASGGSRVLVVAHGDKPLEGDVLPPDLDLVGVVELHEQLRPDARVALDFFARQGVTVRVVSGDSAPTVGAVAAAVGLEDPAGAFDARQLPDDPDQVDEVMRAHRVFGRVKPEQKRVMVASLRRQGHVVAMTGDGVNDTLALKDADLGIAMGSGSAVARGVAQLVLLDDQFEALPHVVAEGRRVLANIESVAALFLVKNAYSLVISVVVAALGWPYPFLPRHLSLISAVGIGLPGFFLALAPNDSPFRPGFLARALRFSLPAGVVTAAGTLAAYGFARADGAGGPAARTAAVVVVMVMSLWVLALAARPLKTWKVALVAAMAALFALAFVVPGVDRFFNLDYRPGSSALLVSVAVAAVCCMAVGLVARVAQPA